MTQALAPRNDAALIEQVMIQGDLSALSNAQRIEYYRRVCESLDLNPLTKPFEYLKLNGKLILYARKDCTDQLRKTRQVSITKLEREMDGDLYVVTAYAKTPDGREDSDMGAVTVAGLRGENLANAVLKAVTKAKRRVTLSICGLGMTDESELDSIPGATVVPVEDVPTAGPAAPPAKAPPPRIERITDPNDPAWKRWLDLVATAHTLDLEYPDLDLPIRYGDLVAYGIKLAAAVAKRQVEVKPEQPADDSQAAPASGRSQFDELYAEIESLCDTAIDIDAEAVEWPWRTREDATIELLIDTIQKQKQAIVDRNAQLDEQKRQERKAAGAAR
jgi:hypothetical protein